VRGGSASRYALTGVASWVVNCRYEKRQELLRSTAENQRPSACGRDCYGGRRQQGLGQIHHPRHKTRKETSCTMNYESEVGTAAPPSPQQFTSQGRGSDGSSSTGTITLAKDNKTITVQEHSKDPKGAEHDQTMVYVRQ
jgi:hypothetical protein